MNTIDAKTVRPGEYPLEINVRKHTFTADASVAGGGQDAAPGPHDYFDSALATSWSEWRSRRHQSRTYNATAGRA